jgi:hypothetical protein
VPAPGAASNAHGELSDALQLDLAIDAGRRFRGRHHEAPFLSKVHRPDQ